MDTYKTFKFNKCKHNNINVRALFLKVGWR
jgi:hypothetical protein